MCSIFPPAGVWRRATARQLAAWRAAAVSTARRASPLSAPVATTRSGRARVGTYRHRELGRIGAPRSRGGSIGSSPRTPPQPPAASLDAHDPPRPPPHTPTHHDPTLLTTVSPNTISTFIESCAKPFSRQWTGRCLRATRRISSSLRRLNIRKCVRSTRRDGSLA